MSEYDEFLVWQREHAPRISPRSLDAVWSAWHAHDAELSALRARLAESEAREHTLLVALAEALIPLEALHAAVVWELAPEVKQEIAHAVGIGRPLVTAAGRKIRAAAQPATVS